MKEVIVMKPLFEVCCDVIFHHCHNCSTHSIVPSSTTDLTLDVPCVIDRYTNDFEYINVCHL